MIEIKYKIKSNKSIIYPNLQDKFLVFIGSLNENNEYITETLCEFNDQINLESFLEEKISKKLLFKDKKCEIFDNNKNQIGTAYEIVKLNQNEITEEISIKDVI